MGAFPFSGAHSVAKGMEQALSYSTKSTPGTSWPGFQAPGPLSHPSHLPARSGSVAAFPAFPPLHTPPHPTGLTVP